MRYLSVCSGIEAASKAWESIGWEPVAFSEIEPFPAAVLKHHWPKVQNLGDMTKYEQWPIQSGTIDLLVGGTPCQSFSVAGLRQGLKDPRGNLMLTYLGIAERFKPRWLVWENVPGVLSSNGGKDFGSFLGALGELGYEWAYRVLDAQWFGVAQRRRRVFVVAHLGKGNFAAKVLFESESVRRDTPPSRKAGQGVATDVEAGVGNIDQRIDAGIPDVCATIDCGLSKQVGKQLTQQAESFYFPIPIHGQALYENHPNDSRVTGPHDVAPSCVSRYGTGGGNVPLVQEAIAFSFDSLSSNSMKSKNPISGCNQVDLAKSLDTSRGLDPTCNQGGMAVAVDVYNHAVGVKSQTLRSGASSIEHSGGVINPADRMAVRRLTPRECERLQGFNDDHTMIPWRNKPADQCPDGPRYKALGNSMAVPCMAWIGERIEWIENERQGAA